MDEVKKEDKKNTEAGNATDLPGQREQENPLIAKIDQLKRQLDESTARAENLLKANEALYTRMALGGNTPAGFAEKKEESAKDYARRVMGGNI